MPDQPTVRMKQFIIELGTYVERSEVREHEFRRALKSALNHVESMPIGSTDRFVRGVSSACGVPPSEVFGWAQGKIMPRAKTRKFILRAAHEYLSARYA